MNVTLSIAFIVYLVVLIGVGFIAFRRTKSFDDYYLAGRKLSPWATALSAEASSESGWLLMGLPGQAFSQGIGAFWVALGCIGGTFFNWTGVAKRLRRITAFFRAITIPDYLETRFDDKTHTLRIISVIVIAIFMTGYIAAQFVAAGKALSVTFGFDYTIAVLLGSAVILFYTMMGGFFAVAWTDVIQALIMIFGLVVIPVLAVIRLGGPAGLWSHLASVTSAAPGYLSLRVGKEGIALVTFLVGMIGIGLGYPGQPHILVRFMAIKKTSLLRRGALIGVIWAVIALYGAVFIGLVGRGMLSGNAIDPERVMPMLAIDLLPAWIAGIIIAALMAAMMSTADSQLLVVSSAVVQDVYHKTLRREPKPKTLVLLSRIVTLAVGLVALAVALRQDPRNPAGVIFWLVLDAWGGLASAFGPVLVLSLYWKRITRPGAISGMIAGTAVFFVWIAVPVLKDFLYVIVPGVVASLLVTVAVSYFTSPPAGVLDPGTVD
jgi:sodium/proline symporter